MIFQFHFWGLHLDFKFCVAFPYAVIIFFQLSKIDDNQILPVIPAELLTVYKWMLRITCINKLLYNCANVLPKNATQWLTRGFKPRFSSQSQGMNYSKRFFLINKCLYQHLTYIRQYCTNTISNLITDSNYDTNNAYVTYSTTSLAIYTYRYSR